MKKAISLFVLFFVSGMLSGCIISTAPSINSVSVNAGETQGFSINAFTFSSDYVWTLDGTVIPEATSKYYQYSPLTADVGTSPHTLTVSVGSDNYSWSVNVLPSPYTILDSEQEAKDILYAAYAGIGYMDDPADNEALYNAMLTDLNKLPEALVLNVILNDAALMSKIDNLLLGIPTTFYYTDDNDNAFSLRVDTTPRIGQNPLFAGTLYANFNTVGYAADNCTYYGEEGSRDLVVSVSGDFKASLENFIEEFNISSVAITAQNTLIAVYPSFQVNYDNWKLAYMVRYGDTPLNVAIVPDVLDTLGNVISDNRDYTLSGSLAVNEITYAFGSGIRYQQSDNGNGTAGLTIGGNISLNSLEGLIKIETAGIIRNSSGIWTTGAMTLSGYNSTDDVWEYYGIDFDNGTASGDPDGWVESDWQNTLSP